MAGAGSGPRSDEGSRRAHPAPLLTPVGIRVFPSWGPRLSHTGVGLTPRRRVGGAGGPTLPCEKFASFVRLCYKRDRFQQRPLNPRGVREWPSGVTFVGKARQ